MLFSLVHLSRTPDIFRSEAHIIPLTGRSNIEMDFLDNSDFSLFKDMIKASMPTVFSSPTTSKIRSTILGKEFLVYIIEKYKLLPLIFEGEYDSPNHKWKIDKSCDKVESTTFEQITGIAIFSEKCHPTVMDGYRQLLLMIDVDHSDTFKKDSNLIQISVKSANPLFAQMLLTKLIDEADSKLRQRAIKLATDNQEYFSSLLSQSKNVKINDRIKTLLTSQIEQAMYAQTKANFLFEIMDPPIVPDQPISPKRPLVLVVSLITSFILGIFIVFALNAFKSIKKEDKNEN